MELTNHTTAVSNLTNQTNMSTIDDWRIQRDAFWKRLDFVQQLLTIFIAVFTILGNSLVIIVTWKEKSLHQPNKYFIVLLAVADLLVGLFVAPSLAYQLGVEFEESESSMSIHLCRFMLWINTFALTTSIYSLTFISFDRYLKISGPLLYKSRMTTSRSIKFIFVIVFISAALATYSAIPDSASYGILDIGSDPCNIHTADLETYATFYLILTIIAFFLPAVIILFMYAGIFLVAHKRNKRLERGELGQTVINHRQRNALRRDMKVIKTLLVVVGAFIFCWGPWFTWTLMFYYYPNIVEWDSTSLSYWSGLNIVIFIANTLPLFNSLCNPIIYACLDETYREAFRQLFRRHDGRGQ